MSDLRKSLRALNHCEEWVEIVEAACLLEGVEPTRKNLLAITMSMADSITLDADTLETDVSALSDADLLAAAATFKPAPEPEEPVLVEPDPPEGENNA
jgi:glycine cleavage system regulatory protein